MTTLASLGTGITDCSVGVPCASGASGRAGRHITTVVVCAAALFTALGVDRLTLRTTLRGDADATFLIVVFGAVLRGAGFGAAFTTGFFGATATARLDGVVFLRSRTTGAFLAGAATGEQTTSESIDAFCKAGLCSPRGTVSRLTACAWAGLPPTTAEKQTANVENVRIVKRGFVIIQGVIEKERGVNATLPTERTAPTNTCCGKMVPSPMHFLQEIRESRRKYVIRTEKV